MSKKKRAGGMCPTARGNGQEQEKEEQDEWQEIQEVDDESCDNEETGGD